MPTPSEPTSTDHHPSDSYSSDMLEENMGTSDHHPSDSYSSDMLEENMGTSRFGWTGDNTKERGREGEMQGARACLFFLFFFAPRDFQCVGRLVVFCWLNCAESSFGCFCASSWRSRSVLKKSASPPSWSPSSRVSQALQLSQECP